MRKTIPHPIPYQGSKRQLAKVICGVFPSNIETLYEPFAGSAAITLYAAQHQLAKRFVIGDSLPALIELWTCIVNHPESTGHRYEQVWKGHSDGGVDYFNAVRERFNTMKDPIDLLYLIVRCVKNAVRFNKHGHFTQSVDRRRLGTHPAKMAKTISEASALLKGKVEFVCADFRKTISDATQSDLVYMDPPYQGTTYGQDKRYFAQLDANVLVEELVSLNDRKVPFILSYDGMTGNCVHGQPLPAYLGLQHFLLNAGRSSQATLNGHRAVTVESLYVSPRLSVESLTNGQAPVQTTLRI